MDDFISRDFTFNAKIGGGSFSNVYQVTYRDKKTGETTELACKHISKLKNNKSFVKGYLPREIAIVRRLSQHIHPNIIQCHSMYESSTFVLIFMRWAVKNTLLERINETEGVREPFAKTWIKQVAEGVKHLHGLQIAHRDIKAENILISRKMTAKIADFGFAKDFSERKPVSTENCGSKHYTAPEVLSVSVPYNPFKSDIWSIGALLYTMLNARKPFDFDDSDLIMENGDQLERPQHPPRRQLSIHCQKCIDNILIWKPEHRPDILEVLAMSWLQN